MEHVQELIRKYGLEEDPEHVIIPLVTEEGRPQRCFLLKRRFLRIVFADLHFHDYPLEELIEATVRHPALPLRDAILLVHREPELEGADGKNNDIRGEGEKEDTD